MITVHDAKKYYGETHAVDGISFEIAPGEIYGLVGADGAGKTTTLEIIETLREKTSGQVTVCGYSIDRNPNEIKQLIGVQLQAAGYYPNISLRDQVKLFSGLYNRPVDPIEVLTPDGVARTRIIIPVPFCIASVYQSLFEGIECGSEPGDLGLGGGDARLVLADMRELRDAVDVADRPHVVGRAEHPRRRPEEELMTETHASMTGQDEQLDRDGYVMLRQAIAPHLLEQARALGKRHQLACRVDAHGKAFGLALACRTRPDEPCRVDARATSRDDRGMTIRFEFLAKLHVDVGELVTMGQAPLGERRVEQRAAGRLGEQHVEQQSAQRASVQVQLGAYATGDVLTFEADGFEGLNSLLPPPPRRGLTLIDPSYEDKRDYRRVVAALKAKFRKSAK